MPLTEPVIINLTPTLSARDILVSMGIPSGREVRPRLKRLINETVECSRERAEPRLLWREGSISEIEAVFPPFRRLARYLAPCQRAVIAAGSIGPEWASTISEETDPMRAYVYSAAGTAIARQTLLQARRNLAQRHPKARIGDSLSPGTDGLPFKLQSDFARLLPLASIGIDYDEDSRIMTPLASVTAIIAWGATVERMEPLSLCDTPHPRCSRCPSPSCQLRVEPFAAASNHPVPLSIL